MDIFKGIGDFFGGLFGQKKKREDEQPQPQQQQSAVSFNSTPKLGDNFAKNSSNPTQPQQPKELPKTGPTEVMLAIIVVTTVGVGGAYYIASRKQLKKITELSK